MITNRVFAAVALVSSVFVAGCGVEITNGNPEPESECPSASDPMVHYASEDPHACAAMDFACPEGQTMFDSEDCGCGCVGPEPEEPVCHDPNDPTVHYVADDPETCALIDYACPPNQTLFTDDCGCGCLGPEEPPACHDPNDPAVHYVADDPHTCQVIDFACGLDQTYFFDDCGCGCIDTVCAGLSESQCLATSVCAPFYPGVCDCACPNNEPGCEHCPASCFPYEGCQFVGE